MKNIKRYTNMTKNEFIEFINTPVGSTLCPASFGLEECRECTRGNRNCKRCWEQAVKNIKFMGDDMMKKEFTKKELKLLSREEIIIIELRTGERGLLLNKVIMNSENFIAELVDYNNNMECEEDHDYDIVKIYKTKGVILGTIFHNNNLELAWERSEVDWNKVKVDAKIEVSACGEEWAKRYFAKYENGIVYAWSEGKTSFSKFGDEDRIDWIFARLYKED